MLEVWFWQRIVSPHMAGLAAALARQGCEVTYVAEQLMSEDRARQGWSPPDLGGARLVLAPSTDAVAELIKTAPADSTHVCQGIRNNGRVGWAQRALARRGLRQWVVMETVEDSGWRGVLKRLEYRRLFATWRGRIEGVLATGYRTPDWVVARGVPMERVFPFAYFLPDEPVLPAQNNERTGRFRFVFVGQFIERKRLDLLISALAALSQDDFELAVIGAGPLESKLRAVAEAALPGHVVWHGQLPIHGVPQVIANADCLVLPSRHDGWGAVVSEALMVGTPAICSERCGSAGVVQASGQGGVFRRGDLAGLVGQLERMLLKGCLSGEERRALSAWGRALGAEAGACYLLDVFTYSAHGGTQPLPPWHVGPLGRRWPEHEICRRQAKAII